MNPKLISGALALMVALAPAQTITARPEFAVASIQLNKTSCCVSVGVGNRGGGGHAITLKMLICTAYRVQEFQISGGPGWIASDRFDVEDAGPVAPEAEKALDAVKTPEDSAKLPFGLRAQLASAAAWSPDPTNPPLYLDLPVKNGVGDQEVLAKWAGNAPLAFVDQYIGNLRQYKAIAIDVGDQDGLKAGAGKLHEILDNYGIANSFEICNGAHQRGRRPFSEPRHAVFQQESALAPELQLSRRYL